MGSGKAQDRFSVTLRLEPGQYAYDLRILLVKPGTSDTLDTIWVGKARDSSDLERLPTRRYRGGPVDAVVWGSQDGLFQWYEVLRYRLPNEPPARERHTRKEFLPFLSLPAGSEQDIRFLAPGEPPAIDTPTCQDRRHKPLAVETFGSVDSSAPGSYSVRFRCRDGEGFQAEGALTFHVLPEDSLNPAILFVGKDTIRQFVGEHVRSPAISCLDYKQRPLPVEAEGRVDTAHLGYYRVRYTCTDSYKRRSDTSRVFAIVSPHNRFAVFKATQETGIDTLGASNWNIGYNGFLPLSRATYQERFFSFFKFDLTSAKALSPVAARIRLRIFGNGYPYPDSILPCRFYVLAMRSAWTEGHGNFYYYGDQWRNKGDEIFANYPLSDSIRKASRPYSQSDGSGFFDRGLVLDENLKFIDSMDVQLPMTPKHGQTAIPKPEDLITVELDIGEYVGNVDLGADHGFLVRVWGIPAGRGLGFVTKEAGEGGFGPELVVEY